jgi:drug/metabolite transporter (DMT)-like permease
LPETRHAWFDLYAGPGGLVGFNMAISNSGQKSVPVYAASQPLMGIAVLALSMVGLSTLDASSKWLLGLGIPLLLLGWFRFTVHFILALAVIVPARGTKILRSSQPRWQVLRGTIMLSVTLVFMTTLSLLPQAEATAISFLAPLIMLILAPWLLKEPIRWSRWVAAAIGFAGVLVIVRPSNGLDPVGTLFGLLAACLFACQHLVTRRVAAVDHPYTTLIWSGGIGTLCMSACLPFLGEQVLAFLSSMSWPQLLLLASTGLSGALGQVFQIRAYHYASASVLAPFLYMQIVTAAFIGWLVSGYFPDAVTWLGIAIICASGIGIALHEWRRR